MIFAPMKNKNHRELDIHSLEITKKNRDVLYHNVFKGYKSNTKVVVKSVFLYRVPQENALF